MATTSAMSAGSVIVLFGTIVLLLALFALGVVLLARSHRRRLAPRDRAAPEPHTHAWREAGRRLRVPDEG
jgi:membrane protein implicated in regulation of membrane protease activity